MFHGPFSSVVHYSCINRFKVDIDAVEGVETGHETRYSLQGYDIFHGPFSNVVNYECINRI